jgi:hypothetical protein
MKFYDLDTEFTEGEFNGKTLKQVLDIQPSYLDWCAINMDQFYLTDVVIEEIKTKIPDFEFSEKGKLMLAEKYSEWFETCGLDDEAAYEDDEEFFETFMGSYTQENRRGFEEEIEDSFD